MIDMDPKHIEHENLALSSYDVNARLEHVKLLEEDYKKAENPIYQEEIVKSLFKLVKDGSEIVRLRALNVFIDAARIPKSMILQTISKSIPPDFSFSTHPHIGVFDALLTDASPAVRVAAIKALSASNVYNDTYITTELMRTAATTLNDSSSMVRTSAVATLRHASQKNNSLFPVEKAQIRMIIAMLQDSSKINRHESALLIENVKVEDTFQTIIMVRGIADAAAKYIDDRFVFLRTAIIFGKNNWEHFHLMILKTNKYFPENFDPYEMTSLVPLVAFFAAYTKSKCAIPLKAQPYLTLYKALSDYLFKKDSEDSEITDHEQFQKVIRKSSTMTKFLKTERGFQNTALYVKGDLPITHFVLNDLPEGTKTHLLHVELLRPVVNTPFNPLIYPSNSAFFLNVEIKLSRDIPNRVYMRVVFSSKEVFIIELKKNGTICDVAAKLAFTRSLTSTKVHIQFYIDINDVNITPISDPFVIWMRST